MIAKLLQISREKPYIIVQNHTSNSMLSIPSWFAKFWGFSSDWYISAKKLGKLPQLVCTLADRKNVCLWNTFFVHLRLKLGTFLQILQPSYILYMFEEKYFERYWTSLVFLENDFLNKNKICCRKRNNFMSFKWTLHDYF